MRKDHALPPTVRAAGRTAGGRVVRLAGWGFRHASRRAWAVRDVDLAVAPGERVLLTGASGAGKSTLLRALGGLLEPGVRRRRASTAHPGPARVSAWSSRTPTPSW